jgi:hypothetical protein
MEGLAGDCNVPLQMEESGIHEERDIVMQMGFGHYQW